MLVVDALSLGDAVLEVVDDTGEAIVIVSFLDVIALPALPMDRGVCTGIVSRRLEPAIEFDGLA